MSRIRHVSIAIFFLTFFSPQLYAQLDTRLISADIVRVLSKDLFDLNSTAFMQPMVETFNATANAGFYHMAFVPSRDTLYIRFGLRGMFGFVRDDQLTYRPAIPTEPTENEVANVLSIGIANKIKTIFKRGIEADSIQIPSESATILGFLAAEFNLNREYLRRELRNDPDVQAAMLDSNLIDQILDGLPAALALPTGADISTIAAIVPQVEVGSLFGTELLLRYVPPVKLDTNVGTFTFWGVGLKHNLSHYVTSQFDLSFQLVYQQTSLKNSVGVTAAELEAEGETFNVNVHASKRLGKLTLYSGLGLERSNIVATYLYTLPRQLQAQLGLITPIDLNNDGRIDDDEFVPDPENGFPGDTKPQQSRVESSASNLQWTIGADYQVGPVQLFADFKVGSFNIFSGGLLVGF
ncbi:MAG: DUF6588 family protein [Candidatus Kapaibacterium sp.]